MPNALVAPAPIEFYCDILTGIEPLTRLDLVIDDDATAEFHTPVKRDKRTCRGLKEITAIIEEHRKALHDGSIGNVVKRFEPEAGSEPGLVELSMQAITQSDDAKPGAQPQVYDIDALYLLKGSRIYHIAEFWSQRFTSSPH